MFRGGSECNRSDPNPTHALRKLIWNKCASWAASIRHLMWKTLKLRNANLARNHHITWCQKCLFFKGSQTSCTEIISSFFFCRNLAEKYHIKWWMRATDFSASPYNAVWNKGGSHVSSRTISETPRFAFLPLALAFKGKARKVHTNKRFRCGSRTFAWTSNVSDWSAV